MKLITTLILLIFYLLSAQEVTSLHNIDQIDMEKIYRIGPTTCFYLPGDNSIWVAGNKSLYRLFQPSGELIKKYDLNFTASYTIDIWNSLLITESMRNGINYLILMNIDGAVIKIPKEHVFSRHVIKFSKKDTSIIVGGLHYTKYGEYLRKYDEDARNPSQFSIRKFREFFENEAGYTLTKYDLNLNLIDSCNFVQFRGKEARGYESLNRFRIWDTFDIDNESGNIYSLNQSEGYKIKIYNSSFEKHFEFTRDNHHFKNIPSNLTREKVNRLVKTAGVFSKIQSIFIVDNHLIASFYDNPVKWETPVKPFYYDIFNLSGDKVHSGAIPYRIFTRDNSGNLYTVIKKMNGWIIKKNSYYLVSFTIDDLMNNRVNEAFMENKIRKYLEVK